MTLQFLVQIEDQPLTLIQEHQIMGLYCPLKLLENGIVMQNTKFALKKYFSFVNVCVHYMGMNDVMWDLFLKYLPEWFSYYD